MPAHSVRIALLVGALTAGSALHAEPEFIVRIEENRFFPAETEIPSGVKVRIVLENLEDTPEEFGSNPLQRQVRVPPRSRVTLSVGPLDPGRYLFKGETSRNHGAGALGVFVVR